MRSKRSAMDELDRKIIAELQRNGRESYKEIARKLDVSDGTVRSRTEQMMRENVLRITASVNPFALETGITALVGMQLAKRTHMSTMERISQLKGVISVCNATGRYDLLVEVFLESRKELNRFLIEDLSRIGGINSTETFIYLDAINKWMQFS